MNRLPRYPKELFDYLVANGFRSPSLEAKLILSRVLDVEVEWIDHNSIIPFEGFQIQRLEELWQGLEEKQPIQYQLGYTWVSGLKILISGETLCPGSQVEHVCAATRREIAKRLHGTMLDLCTGCGVLAIVLASENPTWRVYGTDISQAALEVAASNRNLHNLANVSFHQGDLFGPLAGLELEHGIDLLVSNPPYCRTSRISQRPEQVRRYVPRIALDGGEDGLAFFRAIFEHSHHFLKKGAYLVLEHEIGRAQAICALMTERYKFVESLENVHGQNRIFIARYEG